MNCAKLRLLLLVYLGSMLLLTRQTSEAAELSGSYTGLALGSSINLSAEGELDWAHWGLTTPASFDHKDLVASLISDYLVLGAGSPELAVNVGVDYSWIDGTPTVSVLNSATAVLISGATSGFQIQVPADTFPRRLKLYVSVYSAQGKLEVTLSDGSAPSYTDLAFDNASGESNRVYSLDYAAGTAGQVLTVKFTVQAVHDAILGSVRLHAAALQNNLPPTVILNSPTNETIAASPTSILFDATADDFDVNGSIRQVAFYTNHVLLVAVTNSPYTFVWTNAPVGAYDVTAVATGNDGETAVSDPATVYVYTNIGALSATMAEPPAEMDLTAEGTADWAHWGLFTESSYNHKAGVASQITNFQLVGNALAYWFNENLVGYSWNDGTPTTAATNSTTGVYVTDVGNGFEFTVPADTTLKTLRIYVGAFSARGKLRVLSSDGSSPPVFDRSVQPASGTANAVYTINFRAGSSNQTLALRYTVDESFNTYGNVTLQAATLVTGNIPPSAAITNIPEGTVFLSPTNVSIQATASDADGTVSKVEFFDGEAKLAECLISPYEFVWTNAPPGRHTVTVRATDNGGATFISPGIHFFVSNGGGVLSGRFATPGALTDLSALGTLDWGHWGLVQANSFNHRLSVPQQISNISKIGSGLLQRSIGNSTTFAWTNGTPTLVNPGSSASIFVEGLGQGFNITVPAGTTLRRLRLFLGVYGALGQLQASLSDASAADYVDSSLRNVWDVKNGCYTIDYAAASANKTLTVQFTSSDLYDPNYGNVDWQAATLALPIITVSEFQKLGDSFSLSFQAEAGESYAVEYTDVLPAATWTTLTNVLGQGELTNILDATATAPHRFYRVKLQPPSP